MWRYGALVLLSTRLAAACACAPFSEREACEKTDAAVFLGEVVQTAPPTWDGDESDALTPMWRMLGAMSGVRPPVRVLKRTALVRVLERYRNVDFAEVAIDFAPTDCQVQFEAGRQYLIYAVRENASGKWTTGICYGTMAAKDAEADIRYFRSSGTTESPGRVFGVVARGPRPLPGVSVLLRSGERDYRTQTGADGRYTVRGLQPGRYELRADLAEGPGSATRIIELGTGECSRQNWLLSPAP